MVKANNSKFIAHGCNSLVISQSPTAVFPSVTVASGTAVSNNIIDRFRQTSQVKKIRLINPGSTLFPFDNYHPVRPKPQPTQADAVSHAYGKSTQCFLEMFKLSRCHMTQRLYVTLPEVPASISLFWQFSPHLYAQVFPIKHHQMFSMFYVRSEKCS